MRRVFYKKGLPGRRRLAALTLAFGLIWGQTLTGCGDAAGASSAPSAALTSGVSESAVLPAAGSEPSAAALPAQQPLTGSGRGGLTLPASFGGKMVVLTLYGNSVEENGKTRHVEDPVVQWSGKNLAMDAYYSLGRQYVSLAAVDAALLEPGRRYVISFSADTARAFSFYGRSMWEEGPWYKYDPAAGRGSFAAVLSAGLNSWELARGSRQYVLANGSDYGDILLSDLQIEADGGSGLPSAFEPFVGGSIFLEGVVLRGTRQARDELFLDGDGLWKIKRRLDEALEVRDAPILETLRANYQNQLNSILGREGLRLGAHSVGGAECFYAALPATAEQEARAKAAGERMYGGFIRASGGRLYDESGGEFLIKGLNTGDVWSAQFGIHDHSQSIYRQFSRFGFNTVRIGLTFRKFEKEENGRTVISEEGLDQLEKSIENARLQGLRCIVDLHVPPGGWHGFESGPRLFTEASAEVQARFVNLWSAIARRLAGNKNVIAYGLCNEPQVLLQGNEENTVGIYASVMQRAVDAIRQVDKNHLITFMVPEIMSLQDGQTESWFIEILPGLHDPQSNLMLEHHYYFSRSAPFGDRNFAYKATPENVSASKPVWYDDWHEKGYGGGDAGWKTIEAEVSLKDEEYGWGLFSPNLYMEGFRPGETVYVDRIAVERSRPGTQPETVLDAEAGDRELLACYSDLQAGSFVKSPWDGEKVCWAFTAGADGKQTVPLLRNLAMERGEVYTVRVRMRPEREGAGLHARLKAYVASYEAADPGKPLFQFNDEARHEEIMRGLLDKAGQRGYPVFLGELGIFTESLNRYSGYERWVALVAASVKSGHIQFSIHSSLTEELGLWRDLEGKERNLNEERARLVKKYFLD